MIEPPANPSKEYTAGEYTAIGAGLIGLGKAAFDIGKWGLKALAKYGDEIAEEAVDVTKRPSNFRKQTIQDDWDNAALGSAPGTKSCPTCNKDVTVAPGSGPRDWDVDHQPPWSLRDLSGMNRKQVLDDFNTDTRLECPSGLTPTFGTLF